MTLIEVLISLLFLAVTIVAFFAGLLVSTRAGSTNREYLYATQLMNTVENGLRAGNFTSLGDANTSSTAYEYQFLHMPDVYGDPDPKNRVNTFAYKTAITFTGWGTVATATGTTLQANFPTGLQQWATNEWAGHYVTIPSGKGAGQIMYIKSNTGNTLTLTADFAGAGSTAWTVIPNTTSTFLIDDAKTARIQITYTDGMWDSVAQTFRVLQMNRTVVVTRPDALVPTP